MCVDQASCLTYSRPHYLVRTVNGDAVFIKKKTKGRENSVQRLGRLAVLCIYFVLLGF